MSLSRQAVVYLGVVIGVVFSSAVTQFKAGEGPTFDVSLAVVALAAIIGLVIFPQVYEKLSIRTDAPLLVQLGFAVQSGVFWHVLFNLVGKAMAASH
jgi:hypothetical protein